MTKVFMEGKNFLIVQERSSRSGKCVIKSSGYITTAWGSNFPCSLVQCKTLFKRDRSYLPDSLIFSQDSTLQPYELLNCDVYNLYLKPECAGLQYAVEELSYFLEREFFRRYDKHALVGHSKGGLIMSAVSNYIDTVKNIALVTPTFGTLMGDEDSFLNAIEKYIQDYKGVCYPMAALDIALYKKVMCLVGSRRPVDLDMSVDSEFIRNLDLSCLRKHDTLLVVAQCPEKCQDIKDAIFRHYGKYLSLDKKGDGMVSLEKQKMAEAYVKRSICIEATHPTIMEKDETKKKIEIFLRKAFM